MKLKKIIILLLILTTINVACGTEFKDKLSKDKSVDIDKTPTTEVVSPKVDGKPNVSVEKNDGIETKEFKDNDKDLNKAFEILTSNDLVKTLEYEGAKYIVSYDGNMELGGKSLERIDYIEDNSTHIHISQRYAVDVENEVIYINDIVNDKWVLIEDYVNKGTDEGDLGLLVDYKSVDIENPILEIKTDFYISVVDLAKALNLELEYKPNMHHPPDKDAYMNQHNGRFVFAAGNVVYSSDGVYYINADMHQPVIYSGENIYLNARDVSQAFHLDLRFNVDENAVEFRTNNDEDIYPVYFSFNYDEENIREEKAPFQLKWKNGNYIMTTTNITLDEFIRSLYLEHQDMKDPIYQTPEGLYGIFNFYMNYKGDRITGYKY